MGAMTGPGAEGREPAGGGGRGRPGATGWGSPRRSSYGPNSPQVGSRGARTRVHILDTALDRFAGQGYQATSVEDIARAAGVSRATLYQYFEGKEQVFAELLDECGAALMRLIRRLGPLGPTAAGFDNLHWWLGEWAWVYDRYASMFVQWDVIDHAGRPFRPMVASFVDAYAGRIADRLAESGFDDPDRLELGLALLLVVHRVNLYRHTGFSPVEDRAVLDGLATVVQQVLFPATPSGVLTGLVGVPAPVSPPGPVRSYDPAPRTRHLGRRAAATVARLQEAGGVAFAELGYRHANLDAVAAQAGVARATLYKYFRDKGALLAVLSEEAAGGVVGTAARLDDLTGSGPPDPAALRSWLDDYVHFHTRYQGAFAVWFDDPDAAREIRVDAAAASTHLFAAAYRLTASVSRDYPFPCHVGAMVLLALLQRVPSGMAELFPEHPAGRVADAVALFVERGLLDRAGPGAGLSPRRGAEPPT